MNEDQLTIILVPLIMISVLFLVYYPLFSKRKKINKAFEVIRKQRAFSPSSKTNDVFDLIVQGDYLCDPIHAIDERFTVHNAITREEEDGRMQLLLLSGRGSGQRSALLPNVCVFAKENRGTPYPTLFYCYRMPKTIATVASFTRSLTNDQFKDINFQDDEEFSNSTYIFSTDEEGVRAYLSRERRDALKGVFKTLDPHTKGYLMICMMHDALVVRAVRSVKPEHVDTFLDESQKILSILS